MTDVTEKPVERDEAPPPPDQPRERGIGMVLLQALVSVAVLVGVVFLVWLSFDFLRDADANRFVVIAVALLVGVGGVFALFWGMNRVVDWLPERLSEGVRPYVFIGPALVILAVFLVYPVINTILLSFKDAHSQGWVGLDNYKFVFTNESTLRRCGTRSSGSCWSPSSRSVSVSRSRPWPTGCGGVRRWRSR